MIPIDNSAIPLSFVAGPAVLANVCAILHSGVNIRRAHSVDQWRSLQSVRAGQGGKAAGLYSDVDAAIADADQSVMLFSTASVFAACLGLLLLMTVATTVIQESASARGMMRLHVLGVGENAAPAIGGQP
jgi:hypothetical protein